jgi:DNA polymerase-3 subunit delta'
MFEEVLGQARAAAIASREIETSTLPHALLLTGPEGVGKTTLALLIAAQVAKTDQWPGGLRAHPDIWIEDSPSERIGIDRVRPAGKSDEICLQEFFSRRAYAGGSQVAVMARAERLTEQAANALLKTLEEPPADAHIILCATTPERLPQTIVSRCQTVVLSTVERQVVSEWLTRTHGLSADDANAAAAISSGRPGAALRLATQGSALQGQLDALDEFLSVRGTDVAQTLSLAGKLAPAAGVAGREIAMANLATWASFVRDAICISQGLGDMIAWRRYQPALEQWATDFGAIRLTDILGRITRCIDAVSVNANPRLAYEVLFLALFHAPRSAAAVV